MSGGRIEWSAVRKLRHCYILAIQEKQIDATSLDVLIDIPWGKGLSDPVTFLNAKGEEKGINQVSHVETSIFDDLTIYAAPIRVFLSPNSI